MRWTVDKVVCFTAVLCVVTVTQRWGGALSDDTKKSHATLYTDNNRYPSRAIFSCLIFLALTTIYTNATPTPLPFLSPLAARN